jgi:hypothetical protein
MFAMAVRDSPNWEKRAGYQVLTPGYSEKVALRRGNAARSTLALERMRKGEDMIPAYKI